MGRVEGDDVGQRAGGDRRRGGREIFVETGLELGVEHLGFVAADRLVVEALDLDQRRALRFQHRQRGVELGIGAEPGGKAHHPDPRAAQGVGAERGGEVGAVGIGLASGRIGRVATGDDTEQDRGLLDGAGNRSGGVLADADRDDPAAADHADGRFIPDDAVDRGGAGDRSVGFGADRKVDLARRHRRARSARRSARIAIERMGVAGLATDRAPARDRVGRADIGPFGEVGLAQDDRPRRAQPGDERGVAIGDIVDQGKASGGGRERPDRFDIILDQHRHADHRPAQTAGIDLPRLGDRGRIERHDGIDRRVDPLDPGNGGASRVFGGARGDRGGGQQGGDEEGWGEKGGAQEGGWQAAVGHTDTPVGRKNHHRHASFTFAPPVTEQNSFTTIGCPS